MSVIATLVHDAYRLGLQGKNVDAVVRSAAPNVLDSHPFISVKLETLDQFVAMLSDAEQRFIYVENGRFWFSALYPPEDRCPWPRMYSLDGIDDLIEVMRLGYQLHRQGYDLRPVDAARLNSLIDKEKHPERVRAYRALLEEETRGYATLYEGRAQVRIVSEAILLNSSGKCLVCGTPQERSMTTTLGGADGLMVGFFLCGTCYEEAITYPSLLTYLAEKGRIPFLHQVRPVTAEEVFEIGKRVLQNELGCEIIKIIPERFKATGRRPSGYEVNFRLEGLLNYAYNIFDPSHVEVGRFDSSDHHHDLPVQPDHFHYGLPANNQEVRSSFLTGVPELDAHAVREFLESIGA